MDRKQFLSTGAILSSFAFTPGCSEDREQKRLEPVQNLLSNIPIFCSHEHWGSINSIGFSSNGFVADCKPGALPKRLTSLMDLLVDPYMHGNLSGNGVQIKDDMNGMQPEEAFKSLIPELTNFRMKGTFLCTRLGIMFAYNYDIQKFDSVTFRQIDKEVGDNYSSLFAWYRKLMTKASLSNLIRPVQPEYYFGDFNTKPAQEELAFTTTLLRIDPFLDFWQERNERRDNLANLLNIDPVDANSWRYFLEKLFSYCADKGCIGIKQLQAYSRNLDFEDVSDSEVKFRGSLSETEVKTFQDWVMNAICKLANQRQWPHQIHVGTHNLPDSNPLPLATLARKYPKQKIIMLHCWPFLKEAGFLAQAYPNIYIDTCWQPVLNPHFLRQALGTWLGYIPDVIKSQ